MNTGRPCRGPACACGSCDREVKGKDRRAAIAARARKNEVVIPYCHDTAMCVCPPLPSHVAIGSSQQTIPLDCILVGRNKTARTDRCLTCGMVWTLREYRFTPSRVLVHPRGAQRRVA